MAWLANLGSAVLLFLSMTFTNVLSLVHLNPNSSPSDRKISSATITSPTATSTVEREIFSSQQAMPSDISRKVKCDSNPASFCFKDSQHVYGDGFLLPGANPKTFVVLGENGNYGKDDSHVYWIVVGEEGPDPHQLVGADTSSFVVFPSPFDYFAKDKNYVYSYGGIPITEVQLDPSSFSFIERGEPFYAKDKNGVFFCSPVSYGACKYQQILDAQPTTFVLLSNASKDDYSRAYAKDANHFFFSTSTLAEVDPLSFQITSGNGYDARDKNHKYFKGQIVH